MIDLTYRELQQSLKHLKERGYTNVRLNSKREVLEQAYKEARKLGYEDLRRDYPKAVQSKKEVSNQDSSTPQNYPSGYDRFMEKASQYDVPEGEGSLKLDKEAREVAERLAMEDLLEQAGIEYIYGGTKGHGFWLRHFIVDKEGSTWHSMKECRELLQSLQTVA